MTIYIYEDNLIQLESLKKIVNNYLNKNHCSNVKTFATSHSDKLLTSVQNTLSKNLYFLDIQMQDQMRSGFIVAQKIRKLDPFGILVFVTTHSEFLPLTFKYKVSALDFIDKDLDIPNFNKRVYDCLDLAFKQSSTFPSSDVLSIDNQQSHLQIPFHEILYFETTEINHKIRLVTATKHSEFYSNLNDIKKLDNRLFKCHRSYVINLQNVRKVDKVNKIVFFDNEESCLIARTKLTPLLKNLKKFEIS